MKNIVCSKSVIDFKLLCNRIKYAICMFMCKMVHSTCTEIVYQLDIIWATKSAFVEPV
jgi:hypothetical protein